MEREDGRTAAGWRPASGRAFGVRGRERRDTHVASIRPSQHPRPSFPRPRPSLEIIVAGGVDFGRRTTGRSAPPARARSFDPSPLLLPSFSELHPLIGETAPTTRTDGRRPRRWEESHFSYCFIIRVVNDGVVDTAREEGGGEANRGEERRRAKFHKHVQLIPRDIRARIGS